MRRRRAPLRWQNPIGQGPSVFIGREAEISTFRKAIGLERADTDERTSLVLLVGPTGTGRGALMHQFKRVCEARRPPRCGPVIDVRTITELEPMLESIADALADNGNDPFEDFRGVLRKAGNQRAQRKSGLVVATELAQQGATKANELASGVATGTVRAVTEMASYGARALDRPLAPNAVEQKFIECLLRFAKESEHSPVVLFFGYVDPKREDDALAWIRSRLLPACVAAPVTVVLSAETEADVVDLERLGKYAVLPLDRFAPEESFAFVERAIGIPRTSRLAEQLVADCDGFPERLERYRVYFRERDPAARKAEQLPERAREWAAGGASSFGQLERFTTPAAQRLVVHAAALRWFNAPLLREVAAAAGLGDATEDAVSELLDAARRPPWIGPVGAGWGITVPLRRREFVEECRRIDPTAYREVHLRAYAYHRARLGVSNGSSEPSLARRDNPDDDACVAELLYHRVALDPVGGVVRIADRVAELIVDAAFAEAAKLADIGPELSLPRDLLLLLRELREAAGAVAEGSYGVAAASLDRIATMPGGTARLSAAVAFESGLCAWQLGRTSSEVIAHHRRAEELFAEIPPDATVTRMRVPNLLWLAFHTSVATDDSATALLKRAETLAKSIDDDGLLTDVDQTRAQIVKDDDEALRCYKRALGRLESAKAGKSPASLLSSRASFLRMRGRVDEARADYLRALELYHHREEVESEADVAVELIALELADGSIADTSKWADHAIACRPKDAFLRNGIALAYHRQANENGEDPELLQKAIEFYNEALGLGEEAVIFANRSSAYSGLARHAETGAEQAADYRERALKDLTTAHEKAPHDVRIAVDLSRLQREADDGRASATAATAAATLVETIRSYTGGHRSTRGAVPRELQTLIADVVDLPIPDGPVAFLRSCVTAFPRSAELARTLATALRDDYERSRLHAPAYEALEVFATAGRLFSAADNPVRQVECHLNRAELFAALREWGAAQEAVQHVLSVDPDSLAAQELAERIKRLEERDQWGDAGADALFESRVRVRIANDLLPVIDPAQSGDSRLFDDLLPAMRDAIEQRTGVVVPGVRVVGDAGLVRGTIQFEINGAVRWSLVVGGAALAAADAELCAAFGLSGSVDARPWDGGTATWLAAADAELLQRAAPVPVWDIPGVIAATAQAVLERNLGAVVGLEETATVVAKRGWPVPESELPDLVAIVRRLVDAGLSADLSGDSIGELLACEPRALEERIAALAHTAVPAPPDGLAYARYGEAPDSSAPAVTLRVRIPAGSDPLDLDAELALVAGRICDALSLSRPSITVVEDAALGSSTFAVDLGGITRFQGAARTPVDWAEAYPGAGPDGRTGIFPAAGFSIRSAVGRAVEQVLWDDPGLLLPPAAARALVTEAVGDAPAKTVEALAAAVREVSHRRVPLRRDALPDALRVVADVGVLRDRGSVERHDRSPDRTIPDALPLGIRDTVTVALDQPVTGVRVRVHIRHGYPQDLRVRLEGPDATAAILSNRAERSGQDLTLEATSANDAELARFIGRSSAGEWSLHVADLDEKVGGTLTAWTLEVFARDGDDGEDKEDDAEQVRRHIVRVERLTRELRPFEIAVRLGEALYETVEQGTEEEWTPLDSLLYTVAAAPQSRPWRRADDLDPFAFEVVVNGLQRAHGTIPRASVFAPYVESATAPAIEPWSRMPGSWVDSDETLEIPPVNPRTWLTSQLARTLSDEIAELCDLAWTERLLDLLVEWAPALATAIRERYGTEQTAYALARLASQSYPIRNLAIWETLLLRDAETAPAAEFDAAAPPGLSVAQHAGALAEFVAYRMRDTVDVAGLTVAIQLDEAVADAIAAAVAAGPQPEPVYAYPAGPLLESLDRLLRDGAPQLLVTPRGIRRHVRRLLHAQFPSVIVLADYNVDATVVTYPLTVSESASVTAGSEDGGAFHV